MTREKAIRLLTTKRAQPSTDYQMAEVYTMAIQALSQEPCTDAVSRAKAIENVIQIAKTFAKSDKQKVLCGRIIFMLEHMSGVSEMITEEYYKPCSLCHNADCVWMGGKDTHKLCEDFQALSQEPICDRDCEHCTWTECPIEPCDDAISRRAVLDGIAEWIEDGYADSEADCSHISSLVTHLPSVTQKSKTGHWVADDDRRGDVIITVNGYRCDKCNAFNSYKNNFCPNCGAKMEGSDKE